MNITLDDIGKRVLLYGKAGKVGYFLLSVKYTPGGLWTEVVNHQDYTTGWYSIEDVSRFKE